MQSLQLVLPLKKESLLVVVQLLFMLQLHLRTILDLKAMLQLEFV